MVVIEMNPRVSRSSALASKATGFPIAKIAARLAVGYRLDEIMNDITGETPASFEPTIDYVVTKVPRWAFEKLPGRVAGARHDDAVGRRGDGDRAHVPRSRCRRRCARSRPAARGSTAIPPSASTTRTPTTSWCALVAHADARSGRSCSRPRCGAACRSSGSTTPPASTRGSSSTSPTLGDAAVRGSTGQRVDDLDSPRLEAGEARSGSPTRSSRTCGASPEAVVFAARAAAGVQVTYKTVDTCAAEFAAHTPYHYGTYEDEDEVAPLDRPAVVILGSGPNRIGQGVEFDYCCVHAAFALSDAGYETVMVNCNPETVSTDYDTSDRLFFEPLTPEDVLAVCRRRCRSAATRAAASWPAWWSSLGGQTPLKLAAHPGGAPAIPVLGTSPDSIDLAEDRERFHALCRGLGIAATARRHGHRPPIQAQAVADRARVPRARPPVVRARRAGHADRLRRRQPRSPRWRSSRPRGRSGARAGSRPSGRCSSTASSRTRSRSTSTHSATPPARSSSAA